MFDSEQVWHALQTYKELATNGLDLLSFFLITPELLRVFFPAMKLAAGLLLFLVVIVWYILVVYCLIWFWSITGLWFDFIGWRILTMSALAFLGPIITFPSLLLLEVMSSPSWDIPTTAVTRISLLAGIATFLLSRIIAFALALHEMPHGF
jgi:hypothetical protein